MRRIRVDNYILDEDVETILQTIRMSLTNGKLRDINPKSDDIIVTCPFHSGGRESTPACNIYIGNDSKLEFGFFRCFVCEEKGPFYKFVAACFDSSIEFAKKWLIQHFGVRDESVVSDLEPINLDKPISRTRKLDPSILEQFQDWCPYLSKRKLSRETCEKFGVKYDSRYRQVVFPCYDDLGNLVMMPRRSIDTKTFYLDKDVEKPVYNLNYINKNRFTEVVLTEGPFDCLTGNQYGMPTIATLGNPSTEQIEKINKSCIETLYLMFDNDDAGRSFARKLERELHRLHSSIMTVVISIPDPYKDINDLDKETFIKLINDAKNSSQIIVY